ncbi:TerB N-terminal domain-containing protein [Paenibacillus caui]|uniref:TerB N-terminal domain-containing protein n=1 Tax=Paenibacillus caui TaxID=2873927 RepID=UPI001CA8FB95|nr:TerB N-terminal domain-containing protein [Paenibacillus caui]
MKYESRPVEFAELDLSEEDEGIRIPLRDAAIARPEGETERSSGTEAETAEAYTGMFRLVSRERSFTEEAQRCANLEGPAAPFVPFMSYWPTYEQMAESQSRWYFYWRSEVRKEHYPDTDLSYIFIYIYELIHGIGWDKPEKGYELLTEVWMAYRARHPQLDGYLKEWVSDFVLVHRLDVPLTEIFSVSEQNVSGELADIELLRLLEEQPLQVPPQLLFSLSDYDTRRSSFCTAGGIVELEAYLPKIVALVDSYLLKTSQLRIIDMFRPEQEQTVERYLFRSAVYDDSYYGRTIRISTLPITQHAPLRKYMTELIRFTENKLRKLKGFKGRLRGIALEPEIGHLIERYLEREFSPQAAPVRPKITIDTAKLVALRQDTEYVRSMLTIEDEEASGDVPETELDQEEERDLPDWREEARTALDGTVLDGTVHRESPLTDSISKPSRADETSASLIWDTDGLDEEWALFAEKLGPAHMEALSALVSSFPESELTRVADSYGTMPALLVDEINDAAMETVGDLVIDEARIAEDYQHLFEHLKR